MASSSGMSRWRCQGQMPSTLSSDFNPSDYKLESQVINWGSWGYLTQAVHQITKQVILVRVEHHGQYHAGLQYGSDLLIEMGREEGFPKLLAFVNSSEAKKNYIYLERFGPSVTSILQMLNGESKLEKVRSFGRQMIEIFERLHGNGFLQRSITHEMFSVKYDDHNKVILTNFCKASRYMGINKAKHISFSENSGFLGYKIPCASINCLKGWELSRRDDMESLGYLLIRFATGKLPWEDVQEASTDSEEALKAQVLQIKISTPIWKLCQGQARCFADYMELVMALDFEEEPPYDTLKALI